MKNLTPTKRKIINILKRQHELTIPEMTKHFSISEIAIRKQIHELEQKGYIQKVSHKQKIGRPYYTYLLTKEGHGLFPTQQSKIALELLQDLEAIEGKDVVNKLLDMRMLREKEEFENQLCNTEIPNRISELAKMQNDKGYMLEVNKLDDQTYEVRNFNCPILSLAEKFERLCENEQQMYNELLPNCDVSVNSLIVDGDYLCQWTIKLPKNVQQEGKEEKF